MNLNVILPTTIGVILLALGTHNELQWRHRFRNHVSLTGRVINLHPDDDGDCYPKIEYEFGGRQKRFRSSYSILPTPFIGETVKIVADHLGENAEYFTKKTRWYFTTPSVPRSFGF
jgi:hypothetical protein